MKYLPLKKVWLGDAVWFCRYLTTPPFCWPCAMPLPIICCCFFEMWPMSLLMFLGSLLFGFW